MPQNDPMTPQRLREIAGWCDNHHLGGTGRDLRAHADQLERNAWQPISTAPKDGTPILILDAFYYRADKSHAPHYVLHSAFFNDDGEWEEYESGEILDEDGPAYWLPKSALPKPPEAK